MKIAGFTFIGVSVLLISTGLFITPEYTASHFSSLGYHPLHIIQQIQILRIAAACIGILAAGLGITLLRTSSANGFVDFAARLGKRLESRNYYLSFCFACFIVALIMGYLFTQSGPGVVTDSTTYIDVAENLYSGNGFHMINSDTPYTQGAPLYPLLIAALMHLGLDAEQSGRLVSILCFGLLMFPLFLLGKTILNAVTGYVVCLICLAFTPILWATSHVLTEMPFILLSALAIFLLAKSMESRKVKNWILYVSAICVALAILTRLVGVVLLPVAIIANILINRSRFTKMVLQLLLYGSISLIPVIPWIFRNAIIVSDLRGATWLIKNIGLLPTINKSAVIIVGDFIDFSDFQKSYNYSGGLLSSWLILNLDSFWFIGPAIIAVCIILLAVYITFLPTIRTILLGYLKKNYLVLAYICLYLAAVIIIRSIWGTGMSQRYILPVYPFLILALISFLFYTYKEIEKPSLKPIMLSIITIFCVSLLAIQIVSSIAYYRDARYGQFYNSPSWRYSQAITWAQSNIPDNTTLYSDMADVIYFRLKRQTFNLPSSENKEQTEELLQNLKSEDPVFIICFKGSYRHRPDALSNSEITELNQKYDLLVIAADFAEATIWRTQQ